MTNSLLKRARPDIVEMKPYSSARSLYKKQPSMIFLDANECTFEPFIGADNLSRYPDQQPQKLVDALCRLYDVSSRNIAIARGADEAIDCLIRAFCVPYQDNITICPPTFAMYEHSAKIQGIEVNIAPLTSEFSLDTNRIKEESDQNTKLIFICSPNNPTGNLMENEDILTLCNMFQGTALIVVDETYIEYAEDGASVLSQVENTPNLVVLRTLSKSYAAAGIRCGVAIAHNDITDLILKILPPYPVPQPVVEAVSKILTPDNLQRLSDERGELLNQKQRFIAKATALVAVETVYPSDANYVLIRVKDSQSLIEKCANSNIIIRDQSHQPDLENCIRISIGSEEEMNKLLFIMGGETLPEPPKQRVAFVNRITKETSISVKINLDEQSPITLKTGIGFYDHMLEQVAKHGGFSLALECDGDLEIDPHHTIEDCAITLGQALKEALGDKRGIGRYGFTVPMDEALAQAAIDLSSRFYLKFNGDFPENMVGDLPTDMIEHVFRSFAENLGATLQITVEGENTHHMVESCFKALGRVLRQAIQCDGNDLPSTKGAL